MTASLSFSWMSSVIEVGLYVVVTYDVVNDARQDDCLLVFVWALLCFD